MAFELQVGQDPFEHVHFQVDFDQAERFVRLRFAEKAGDGNKLLAVSVHIVGGPVDRDGCPAAVHVADARVPAFLLIIHIKSDDVRIDVGENVSVVRDDLDAAHFRLVEGGTGNVERHFFHLSLCRPDRPRFRTRVLAQDVQHPLVVQRHQRKSLHFHQRPVQVQVDLPGNLHGVVGRAPFDRIGKIVIGDAALQAERQSDQHEKNERCFRSQAESPHQFPGRRHSRPRLSVHASHAPLVFAIGRIRP